MINKKFWLIGVGVIIVIGLGLFIVGSQTNLSQQVTKNQRSVYLSASSEDAFFSLDTPFWEDVWEICVDELPRILAQSLINERSKAGHGFMFKFCFALPVPPKKTDCSAEEKALDNLNGNLDSANKNLDRLNNSLEKAQKNVDKLNGKNPLDEVAVEAAQQKADSIQENITSTESVIERVKAEIPDAQAALDACQNPPTDQE